MQECTENNAVIMYTKILVHLFKGRHHEALQDIYTGYDNMQIVHLYHH